MLAESTNCLFVYYVFPVSLPLDYQPKIKLGLTWLKALKTENIAIKIFIVF